jgi:hypothetical protein
VSEKAKLIRGDPPKIALKRRGSPLKNTLDFFPYRVFDQYFIFSNTFAMYFMPFAMYFPYNMKKKRKKAIFIGLKPYGFYGFITHIFYRVFAIYISFKLNFFQVSVSAEMVPGERSKSAEVTEPGSAAQAFFTIE